ncbi:MAG: TRAP transporter substrate-binding protein DctP [Ectothiorhodospiraceae bacterium]|nr:TRAP transporter substrate-binding protein DctP [Ectothiorhodospiraceae bacterium]
MTDNIKMSRRKFLGTGAKATVGAAAILGAPAVIASPNRKIKWRMQTHWPQGTWYYRDIFEEFAKRVYTATDGELEIETHAPGSVVGTMDKLTAVRRGTLDAAFTFPAYWIGQMPVAGHLNGNLGTFDSKVEMEYFMYEMGALDIIREAYAERGLHLCGPVASGGVTVFAKHPLRTLSDFRGYNIRTTGTAARVFEKLGAAPVSISGGELYQALQTGVVDAAHWGSVSGGMSMNFNEVTSYIMLPEFINPTNGEIFVSLERWNALGSDHKQILDDAVRAISSHYNARVLHHDLTGMRDFVENDGGEIVHMEDEVMEAVRVYTMEVVDEVSERDPDYSGRVGALLHEFMQLTGKV